MTTQSVGRYRLGEELHRGGLGVVYQGKDPGTGKRVVLRCLPRELAGKLVRDRLLQSRMRLESLAHPCFVRVYDVLEVDKHLWLVQEQVSAITLDETLRDDVLTANHALLVHGELAHALGAAHARGLVHGALGPSRVRLDPICTRLEDMGLATATGATSGFAIRRSLESDAYQAPELLGGRSPTPRSDVYSLCACLLTSLTGDSPPADEEDMSAALDEVEAEAPAWVLELLRLGLSPQPEHRQADCGVVAAIFEANGYSGPHQPPPEESILPGDSLDDVPLEEPSGVDQVSALAPGAAMLRLRSPRRKAPPAPEVPVQVEARPKKGAPTRPAPSPEEEMVLEAIEVDEDGGRRRGGALGALLGLGLTGMALVAMVAACAIGGGLVVASRTLSAPPDGVLMVDNSLDTDVEVICTPWSGSGAGEPADAIALPAGASASIAIDARPSDCRAVAPDGTEVWTWSVASDDRELGWSSTIAAAIATIEDPVLAPVDALVMEDTGKDQPEVAEVAAGSTSSRRSSGSTRSASAASSSSGTTVDSASRGSAASAPSSSRSSTAATVPTMAELSVRVSETRKKYESGVGIYVDELRLGEQKISTKVAVGQHNLRISKPDKVEIACVIYVPPEGLKVSIDPDLPRCP